MNSQWVVMEAKGRTNTMENTLLQSAKNQTQNLKHIGADKPNLRVAVVTHFRNGKLLIDWADPKKNNELSFDIETTKEELVQNYYKAVFGILSSNKVEIFGDFKVYVFEDINIIIGLDIKVYNSYEKKQYQDIVLSEQLSDIQETSDDVEKNEHKEYDKYNFFVGNDRILIGIGENWSRLLQENKVLRK